MRYRRQDTFRFQFDEPVNCTFKIIKVDDKERNSKVGKAEIYDISEGGLKLTTPLNIPFDKNVIEIEILFTLNKEELLLTGVFLWKKDQYQKFSYGVKFTIDETLNRHLIGELKIYSRGIAVIKKN